MHHTGIVHKYKLPYIDKYCKMDVKYFQSERGQKRKDPLEREDLSREQKRIKQLVFEKH